MIAFFETIPSAQFHSRPLQLNILSDKIGRVSGLTDSPDTKDQVVSYLVA